MCKSGGTSSTTSVQSIPPEVMANYNLVANKAKAVADQPYVPFSGGFNTRQQQAFSGIDSATTAAQPYYQQAGVAAGRAAQTAQGGISNYLNPYQQQVIDATSANLDENDAVQRAQLTSQLAGRGSTRNSRAGIAQAELARQQNLARAQTIAGLNSQNYQQALGASQADIAAANQAAQLYGQLGTGAQGAALQGYGAQLTAGTQQQDFDREMYQAQKAYPFESTGWLANIVTGIGNNSGGTTTTQQPKPSVLSQLTGGVAALGGLLASDPDVKDDIEQVGELFDGTPVYRYRYKGDDTFQIGLLSTEVDPEAVEEGPDGIERVDYLRATQEAAGRQERAAGGPAFSYVPAAPLQGGVAGNQFPGAAPMPQEEDPAKKIGMYLNAGKGYRNAWDKFTDESDPEAEEMDDSGDMSARSQGHAPKKDFLDEIIASIRGITGFAAGGAVNNKFDYVPDPDIETPSGVTIGSLRPIDPQLGSGWEAPEAPEMQSPGVAAPTASAARESSGGILAPITEGAGLISDDMRMALIAGGLATMAGESPYAAANIGKGGLAGLETYLGMKDRAAKAEEAAQARAMQERQAALEEKRYGLTERQMAEEAAYRQAQIELERNKDTRSAEEKELARINQERAAAGNPPLSLEDWIINQKRAGSASSGVSEGKLFDLARESKESASKARAGLSGLREAERSLDSMFSGAFADYKVQAAKIAQSFGLTGDELNNAIANSESFKVAMAPAIASVMKETVGNTQLSNSDREFAQQAAGGDINLTPQTLKRVISIQQKAAARRIRDHNSLIDKQYPAGSAENDRLRSALMLPDPGTPLYVINPNDGIEYRSDDGGKTFYLEEGAQ